jgi:hypothetical protein
MLRTNLSTRPFYNERAVRIAIATLAVLTAALTAFNAAEILSLNARNTELASRVETSEAKAADLRRQAITVQQTLNREEVNAVQNAAREANLLIDRRAFSWTTLFNQFEDTLPPDVRILAVSPQIDREGRMLVAITVIARRDTDLDTFIERLESTGAFSAIISRQDETLEDGTLRAALQGYYTPVARPVAAVSSPPASDSTGPADERSRAGNQSSANASPVDATPRAPSAGGVR